MVRLLKEKKGVVLGISEEDGIIYGYTILLFDIKYCIYIDKKYIIPTGKNSLAMIFIS